MPHRFKSPTIPSWIMQDLVQDTVVKWRPNTSFFVASFYDLLLHPGFLPGEKCSVTPREAAVCPIETLAEW